MYSSVYGYVDRECVEEIENKIDRLGGGEV